MKNHRGWWVGSIGTPIGYQGWIICADWCEEMWGDDPTLWQYHGEGIFVFKRKKDYILFLLRWT